MTPGQGAEVSAYAQAAFDAFWASPALGEEPPSPLSRESAGIRNAWERAVGAVLKDAFPGLRRELNAARAALAAQPARPAPGDVKAFTWAWREQPPMNEIAEIIAQMTGGAVCLSLPETGSDEYELVITRYEPQPAPELAALRELLDEIGVMAANAPEDGDSFGLLEEIAMRIAAAGVPVEGK